MLGKLEEMVAMALMHAGRNARASDVYGQIEDRIAKPAAFGAVYTTLERMVDKKLIDVVKEDIPGRNGRQRKLYTLNGEGQQTLSASLRQTGEMRAGAQKDWGWGYV